MQEKYIIPYNPIFAASNLKENSIRQDITLAIFHARIDRLKNLEKNTRVLYMCYRVQEKYKIPDFPTFIARIRKEVPSAKTQL